MPNDVSFIVLNAVGCSAVGICSHFKCRISAHSQMGFELNVALPQDFLSAHMVKCNIFVDRLDVRSVLSINAVGFPLLIAVKFEMFVHLTGIRNVIIKSLTCPPKQLRGI